MGDALTGEPATHSAPVDLGQVEEVALDAQSIGEVADQYAELGEELVLI